jgi:hypothetical protein
MRAPAWQTNSYLASALISQRGRGQYHQSAMWDKVRATQFLDSSAPRDG